MKFLIHYTGEQGTPINCLSKEELVIVSNSCQFWKKAPAA